MEYVHGKIYRSGKFENGYIGFEDGMIKSSGTRPTDNIRTKALASGLIVPTFRNAHTHLADSFLFGHFASSSINKLVDPKKGLKIKKLKAAPAGTIINATREVLTEMIFSGTSSFIDFREMGVKGIKHLEKSIKELPIDNITLGRPFDVSVRDKELNEILDSAHGIGLSAISDWPKDTINKIARAARRRKKLFALHVSEVVREDIDTIVSLKPDFIVHMLKATESDMRSVAEHDIPVVICPRANMFYGKSPNINAMSRAGIKLMLGTDNSMITKPDMMREIEFTYRCAKLSGGISPDSIMKIVFDNPEPVFERKTDYISNHFKRGNEAKFIVINVPGLNGLAHPENLLCLGLSSIQIELIAMNRFLWRRLK